MITLFGIIIFQIWIVVSSPLKNKGFGCWIGHSRNLSDLISGIVWVTSVSYNWSMVSKVTVNQLKLAKITQAIPDILAWNGSVQSSQSFWSGQFQESNNSEIIYVSACDRETVRLSWKQWVSRQNRETWEVCAWLAIPHKADRLFTYTLQLFDKISQCIRRDKTISILFNAAETWIKLHVCVHVIYLPCHTHTGIPCHNPRRGQSIKIDIGKPIDKSITIDKANLIIIDCIDQSIKIDTHTGCGHTTELNRDLASKSRLTSNHDLANNRDLIYFWSDYRVKTRFVTVKKTVNHAKTRTDDIGCVVCNTKWLRREFLFKQTVYILFFPSILCISSIFFFFIRGIGLQIYASFMLLKKPVPRVLLCKPTGTWATYGAWCSKFRC